MLFKTGMTEEQFAKEVGAASMDEIAQQMLEFREAMAQINAEAKRQVAEINELNNILAGAVNEKFLVEDVTSLNTGSGLRLQKRSVSHYRGSDWDIFYKAVVENNAAHLFQKRLAPKAVEDFLAENPDQTLDSLGLDVWIDDKISVVKK